MLPLIKLPELPYSTATPDANATVPVVLNNTTTVRVPWTVLTAAKVSQTSEIPVDYASTGEEDQLAFSSDALYIHHSGEWRKLPAYKTNWNDLTSETRALLVNKEMSLTDAELANVRNTLGIGIATSDRAGLVKAATQSEQQALLAHGTPAVITSAGLIYTPAATGTTRGTTTVWDGEAGEAASHNWVVAELNALSNRITETTVATPTTIGGLLAGRKGDATTPGDPFYVDQVTRQGQLRAAAVGIAGIVELADNIKPGVNGVPTANQVYNAITESTSSLGVATTERAGLVRPMPGGVWGLTVNPEQNLTTQQIASGVGPIYLQDGQGGVDVYPASTKVPGVVMCYDTMPAEGTDTSYYKKVFSIKGVETYVRGKLASYVPPASAYPLASGGTAGAVLPGDTMEYDADLGLLNVPSASKYRRGTVYLSGVLVDGTETGGVPTAEEVKAYVTSKLAGSTDVASTLAAMQAQISSLQAQIDALKNQSELQ